MYKLPTDREMNMMLLAGQTIRLTPNSNELPVIFVSGRGPDEHLFSTPDAIDHAKRIVAALNRSFG
jgi:hypothetical protein